jgi:hypothetical protein
MNTSSEKVEPDIKSVIKAAKGRLGWKVCMWYLWEDDSAGYCPFADMRDLTNWHMAPRFWTQERAVVLRHDGLFETCRNPLGGFGQKGPGFIPILSQWALRPVSPANYATIARRFGITASQLDRL